ASLVRKQFVRSERSDVPGIEALAFRHLMIRDAAYDGTPKVLRAELHERFADWLEALALEQQELIGFHLEQAHSYPTEIGGDPEPGRRLAERASAHLLAAGSRAWERFDIHATIGLLSRAIELIPRDEPAGVPASIDLAAALTEAGEFARADAVL